MEKDRSNILFASNIYPVKGDIISDEAFLAKVVDYNRLKSLQKRYYQIPLLSEHQRTIIREEPSCAWNREDPCYGMVKMDGKYKWLCMCTKTDCSHFAECRRELPFDPIAEKNFMPIAEERDEYGYREFRATCDANPLLIGENVEYGRTGSGVYKVKQNTERQVSPFKKLLTTKVIPGNHPAERSEIAEEKRQPVGSTGAANRSPIEQKKWEQVTENSGKEVRCPEKNRNAQLPHEEYVPHEKERKYEAEPSCTVVQDGISDRTREEKPTCAAPCKKEQARPVEETCSTQKPHNMENSQINLNDPKLNVFDYFKECTQQDIIEANSGDLIFVDAGPGTGKTYTLIQKLNHMVSVQGVDAEGILVLCFTNAAVDEIKMRLRQFVSDGADRSLINVDVRTFHSFAWWLINQANELFTDAGWYAVNMRNQTFETSLIKAGDAISQFGDDIVANWEHFIVDEVQDLTNTLGRFVLKIVKTCIQCRCGVTVLGDACQAIYDYDQNTTYSLKSGEFYQALFRLMYGKAKFVSLIHNHRQGTNLINLTSGLRKAILSADTQNMKNAVDDMFARVEKTGTTSDQTREKLRDDAQHGKTVSLLLRNNGQTLKMSSDLRKRGIDHVLNVSETRNNFAPWIADIFSTYEKTNISEDKFLDEYEEVTGQSGDLVWRRLQKLLHTDNDVLNVRDLLDAIATSKIDDPLLRNIQSSNIIVSNIHRSKGREYDSVVVDQSFVENFGIDSTPDEYKTLYVAITRPRSRLIVSPLNQKAKMKTIHIFDTNEYRWGRSKGRKLAYLEFKSDQDLNCNMFAGIDQEVFYDIAVGDPITLKRKLRNNRISYSIFDENAEMELGSLTQESSYVRNLQSYMQISDTALVEMPSMVSDLYISGIYSQVVDEEYLQKHPEIAEVAPNGVWKWVELVGLGHADYDVY